MPGKGGGKGGGRARLRSASPHPRVCVAGPQAKGSPSRLQVVCLFVERGVWRGVREGCGCVGRRCSPACLSTSLWSVRVGMCESDVHESLTTSTATAPASRAAGSQRRRAAPRAAASARPRSQKAAQKACLLGEAQRVGHSALSRGHCCERRRGEPRGCMALRCVASRAACPPGRRGWDRRTVSRETAA